MYCHIFCSCGSLVASHSVELNIYQVTGINEVNAEFIPLHVLRGYGIPVCTNLLPPASGTMVMLIV